MYFLSTKNGLIILVASLLYQQPLKGKCGEIYFLYIPQVYVCDLTMTFTAYRIYEF